MPDDRAPLGLYDQDFDAWATGQAAALRDAGDAVARFPDRLADRLQAIDWENLAEEIEGLAKRDRRELGSRLALIIEHLIKLQCSPHLAPRPGWIETVRREREEIEQILADSPSLRREIPGLLARRSDAAVKRAAQTFAAYGETADAMARLSIPYRPDEVLGDWFPDEPPPRAPGV
jgi:hypothetical protein